MTNVQVTNGTIKYGRTIKTGDFENKRGDVELSFNVPEGEDPHAAIEHVKGMTHSHCHSLLNHKEAVTEAPVAKKAPGRPPAMPKASIAKAAPDASAVVEDDPLADRADLPAVLKSVVNPPVEENLDDLMGGVESVSREITDKEITDATQKCQVRAKNGPAIRKLLNELGVKTPPGRLFDLLQEKRQEYLDKLEAIQPLA